jgi:hypothetical protein
VAISEDDVDAAHVPTPEILGMRGAAIEHFFSATNDADDCLFTTLSHPNPDTVKLLEFRWIVVPWHFSGITFCNHDRLAEAIGHAAKFNSAVGEEDAIASK